jgi:multidrug resistance efflux pump
MPASAMFDIVNVSKLKLKVTVNETQVASLKTGSPVTVSASVFQIKYLLVKSFSSPQSRRKLKFCC